MLLQLSDKFPIESISDEWYERCALFAEGRKKYLCHYNGRGQSDIEVKVQQALDGQLGEVVAWQSLSRLCDVSEPDFIVYEGVKPWLPDLRSGGVEFCVKTCTRERDVSWIFQLKDEDGNGRDKHIFDCDTPDRYAVWVVVDRPSKLGRILALTPVLELHGKNLFDMPFKIGLRRTKRAVYWYCLNVKGAAHGFEIFD